MCDVTVIGAGPVGLWTAIELIHYGFSVEILEKRSEYQRTQRVWISKERLLKHATSPILRNIIQELPIPCSINAFEKILSTFVTIRYNVEVNCLDNIFSKWIIIASGSNTSLYRGSYSHKQDFFTAFTVETSNKNMNNYDMYKLLKLIGSVGWQHHGSMTFLIPYTFLPIGLNKKGSFRNPWKWYTNQRIPMDMPCYLKNIAEYFRRASIVCNTFVDGDIIATVYPIGLKIVSTPVISKNVVMVGDAAMSLPFFQGLNTGLQLGSILAKAIKKNEIALYEKAFDNCRTEKTSFVYLLVAVIYIFQLYLKISNIVPWQVVCWDKNTQTFIISKEKSPKN